MLVCIYIDRGGVVVRRLVGLDWCFYEVTESVFWDSGSF